MPRLTDLLRQANIIPLQVMGDAECAITSLASDSRQVFLGALFIAITGNDSDGMAYVEDALYKGAKAVLSQTAPAEWPHAAAWVQVADVRAAIAALASVFFPLQPQYMFGITGTDGKTSTADFVRQLADLLQYPSASIGTLGLRSCLAHIDAQFPARNTSPEPILLHRTLQQLAEAGVQHVAVEASSHGLDQKRLDGVKFAAAAFTNLTRDHLDYHGTVAAYAAAKTRLFSKLLPPYATAVLNRDDGLYSSLHSMCKKRGIAEISFGYKKGADYRIARVAPHAHGLDATVVLNKQSYDISLPLYGDFQLMNMLAAVGLLHSAGVPLDALVALLPQLRGVHGRLEKIAQTPVGAPIFVDYAHTPAALENILKTMRVHCKNNLHVVFGCGGDRDAGKRPEMGRIATKLADHVIVTDDNPRGENPAEIRDAILRQAPGAKNIADRAVAIKTAVQQLQAGDVLVVAGKGHEQTQIIGTQSMHFSDAEQIQQAVRNL